MEQVTHGDGARVSIGLPVYNGERFLDRALTCLRSQTFREFELVISDNGSTDETAAICARHAAEDGRIRYLREETNRGASWNFNNVVRGSTADYFMWAAHDDLWHETYVARCVELLDARPDIVHCYAGGVSIDEHDRPLRNLRFGPDLTCDSQSERLRRYFSNPTAFHSLFGLIRRSALGFTDLMPNCFAGDVIFLAQLSLVGRATYVDDRLFYNRDFDGRATRVLTESEAAAWYDPANAARTPSSRFTQLRLVGRAIRRVPMSMAERVRCALTLLRWANWNRRFLLTEAMATLRPSRP
ncbi:MAG TPA: glycosyltransferase family 2 protein [Vicinamibacterales bacterium]|jgi:glycosyltransferase involved in cell wall biosynthesis